MKIALVVPGKFHAFDLANAFAEAGHQVILITNYPRSITEQELHTSIKAHQAILNGLLVKLITRISLKIWQSVGERWLLKRFTRYAKNILLKEKTDLIHAWSGCALEILKDERFSDREIWLMRGSAHIQAQYDILKAEQVRSGKNLELPTTWMINREETEYQLARQIRVLSSYAKKTFIEHGVEASKLLVIGQGTTLNEFSISPEEQLEREHRIRTKQSISVLYVGAITLQKGFADLVAAFKALNEERFQLSLAGRLSDECKELAAQLPERTQFLGFLNRRDLRKAYVNADLFVFPTVQDGFAAVIPQALASGLPVITTRHCGGADLLEHDVNGCIIEAASPDALIHTLKTLEADRGTLGDMSQKAFASRSNLHWESIVHAFESELARC